MLRSRSASLVLLTLFIVPLCACSPTDPERKDPPAYKVFSEPALGIKLQYPPELTATTTDPACLVRFTSAKENDSDKFIENIGITVKDVDPKIAQAAKLFENEKRNYEEKEISDTSDIVEAYKQVPNFRLISAHFVNYGAFEGERVIFTSRLDPLDIEVIHVAVLKNGKSYMFTYTGEAKHFDTYSKLVDAMIRSTEFIPLNKY